MSEIHEQLRQLQSLLQLEKEEEIQRYEAYAGKTGIKQRKADGLCCYPLKVKEEGYGLGDRPFAIFEWAQSSGKSHRFQAGQTVRLFTEQLRFEGETCQGVVHFADRQRMKVTLYADEHPEWLDHGKTGVDLLLDLNSYKEMEIAVQKVLLAGNERLGQLRDTLYGVRSAQFKDDFIPKLPHLNASQQAAVSKIVNAEDVALVHGPPGTGKTTTLTAAIRLLAHEGQQLLVCAPGNAATDFLARKLSDEGLNVVRVGNLSRIDEALVPLTLEGKIGLQPEYKQIKQFKKRAEEFRRMAGKYKRKFGPGEREQRRLLYREAKEMAKEAIRIEDHAIDRILDEAHVVATTLVGSANKWLRDRVFSVAVVDEAAQAMEPATWIPISRAQKVVLAGDPFQLPPTIRSGAAAKGGLDQTLLEKAMKFRPGEACLLNVQYRMHQNIMAFPNRYFYDNALQADPSVADRALSDEVPVEFMDTAGCGFDEKQDGEGFSLTNPGEADVLMKHLEQLGTQLQGPVSVGVIAPYKEQVVRLRERWEKNGIRLTPGSLVDIMTVDAFQGQERDIIYLSLVRSNEKGQIGFLSDVRRMNVAMTRARKKLVVIGDSATIGSHRFYRKFLEFAEQEALYRSAWEFVV